MDIKAFECIMKVAEKESISKAAEELFVSQSHLSRIVRKVESKIGIKIFKRSNKGVEVTEEGQVFLNYSVRILNSYDEIFNIKKVNLEKAHSFNLTTMNSSLVTESFIELMSRYDDDYGVDFSIRETYAMIPVEDVYYMRSDLGVIYIRSNELESILEELKSKRMSYEKICSLENCVVIKSDHPLALKEKVYIEDLYDYGFVGYTKGYLSNKLTFANQDHYQEIIDFGRIKNTVKVNNRASLHNVINQTDYFSLGVQQSQRQHELFNTISIPIEDVGESGPLEMGVVYQENIPLNYLEKEFIEILKKNYGCKL